MGPMAESLALEVATSHVRNMTQFGKEAAYTFAHPMPGELPLERASSGT